MSASAEQRAPFDLATEMRSVSIRAVVMQNGIITMLAMDQLNHNEVIAFLTCDERAGKLKCSDRHNRAVFTGDCGIQFQTKSDISIWVNQSKEEGSYSCIVRYLKDNRWMVGKTPLSESDSNLQYRIEYYKHPPRQYWLYTVTNKHNEEVCIIRYLRETINITYFQAMDDEAKFLLLAFSAKRLYIDICLVIAQFPNIVISGTSPSTNIPNIRAEKDFTIAEANAVERPSVDFLTIVDVIFHRAGYNKALGIQYYDLLDRKLGITQLTFEVSLEDQHNFTAVLKDSNGTTIMRASISLREFMITLMPKETFTYRHLKIANEWLHQCYDADGNIFLSMRNTNNKKKDQRYMRKFIFYYRKSNKSDEPYKEATVVNKGPNHLYVTFNNPMMDARRKVIVFAFAMRSAILDCNSHTVAMPPIEYCYGRKC